MTRLREEILGIVGHERAPTLENVKNMKFLRAVINGEFIDFLSLSALLLFVVETLRLCPVV